MIKELIDHIGLKLVRSESDEYICICPWCNSDHLSINKPTGFWRCLHGCKKGNIFELVRYITKKEDREVFLILEKFKINGELPVVKKPKKLWLSSDNVRPLTSDELSRFCKVKKLIPEAFKKLQPFKHKTEPWVLLPAYTPNNLKAACGWIRIGINGQLIDIKSKDSKGVWKVKQEKYPVIKGSLSGLVGLRRMHKDKNRAIIYAEGWKDAHAAISIGFSAICNNTGAGSWLDGWLPAFKDKIVYIIFDRDKAGVEGALKAAAKIETVAKEVYIVELPYECTKKHGKDLYDYVITDKHTHEDLSQLLHGTQVYSTIMAPDGESESLFVLDDDGADKCAKAFMDNSIGQGVIYKHHPFDGWTCYENEKYRKIEAKHQLAKHLSNFLSNCWFKRGGNKYRIKLTNSKISDIISQLSFLKNVSIKEDLLSPCWLNGRKGGENILAAKNCLVDMTTKEVIPFTKDFYTTNYLPYNYEPDAFSEKWGNFLLEITNSDVDMMLLLQMWCGYLLMTNDDKQQSFLLCVGDGANGKGVFFDTIAAAIGRNNVSNLPISYFDQPHKVFATYGKLVNMSDETSKSIEAEVETSIKAYTGGTAIYWEQKFGFGFQAKPTAKLMFATNNLPPIRDVSDGIWRRMIYLPFDVKFAADKQNKNLSSELQDPGELSGILNWMLEGRDLLIKNGRFVIPERCQRGLEQYRIDSNSALGFITDTLCVDDDFNYSITAPELYGVYQEWCKNNGCYSKNNIHFGRELNKQFPGLIKKQIDDLSGRRISTYKGIKWQGDIQPCTDITHDDYEAL